jgi:Holliday junction resolvase-like predicted endonuclease
MPQSTNAKGAYHVQRTVDWLEDLGYTVAKLERSSSVRIGGRTVYRRGDVWGSDLVARNADHLVFVQVKANRGDISRGIRALSSGPWPRHIARWVVHWPAGRRKKIGPDIWLPAEGPSEAPRSTRGKKGSLGPIGYSAALLG